jgi:hypothetical protein
MKMLTVKQMKAIMKDGTIDKQSKVHKKQIFAFAFGGKFMSSKDKGTIKQYKTK